ncbi:MAG: periplasmic nitrate reductase, NapE protein [Burkholderiales bacterium]|nr:periplasmic nitrate reductase, NapE protein [Burkholderiales bacterium]
MRRNAGAEDRGEMTEQVSQSAGKTEELRSFLFLTIVMVPVLTGLLIAGYGFAVWMYQLIAGPPTGG